jgi:anti-sigma regulatory factor (Ser/Thr protein kinase)
MATGMPVPVLKTGAASDAWPHRRSVTERVRAGERCKLRAWLRMEIVPGLQELADPAGDPAVLKATAAAQAGRLRAELEDGGVPKDRERLDTAQRHASEDEREWIRGHLHDTALQILEFIAGDGFGTGLSAAKIAHLAGGAARDLLGWLESSQPRHAQLVPELEQVTAEALDPRVRLVVGELGPQPTDEQVAALTGAVREALTNARKHAHASQVTVWVGAGDGGHTAVTVTDDGDGFDPDRVRGGLGLAGSIFGRMQRAGGHASLGPAPGGGTCVTLATRP